MHDIHALSIIGLGKLGIPMAACFASSGYRVIGVDRDPTRVAALHDGVSPIHEPGLQPLLTEHADRITATLDARQAVLDSQATFIVVPTPSTSDGTFTCRYVLEACRAVGAALRDKARPHLVVITSTVMPGDTAGPIRAALEEHSRKSCDDGLMLCYSPEFIALGSVIRDFLHPDMLLIGQCSADAGDALERIMRGVCVNQPAVARMAPVNAELAKLAVNSFVTTKITFANMLARLCEELDGANVDEVTAALGLDSRIGRKYLKGATAFGGPCFPRDSVALAALGRRQGCRATLAEATDAANRAEVRRLADLVCRRLPAEGHGVVGVLGLAYKPDTDVCEQSAGILLAAALAEAGVSVVAYDPAAVDQARAVLGDRVTFAATADACVKLADVVVLTTPWPEFGRLAPDALARGGRRRVVIDCWRMLDGGAVGRLAEYVPLGVGKADVPGVRVVVNGWRSRTRAA